MVYQPRELLGRPDLVAVVLVRADHARAQIDVHTLERDSTKLRLEHDLPFTARMCGRTLQLGHLRRRQFQTATAGSAGHNLRELLVIERQIGQIFQARRI